MGACPGEGRGCCHASPIRARPGTAPAPRRRAALPPSLPGRHRRRAAIAPGPPSPASCHRRRAARVAAAVLGRSSRCMGLFPRRRASPKPQAHLPPPPPPPSWPARVPAIRPPPAPPLPSGLTTGSWSGGRLLHGVVAREARRTPRPPCGPGPRGRRAPVMRPQRWLHRQQARIPTRRKRGGPRRPRRSKNFAHMALTVGRPRRAEKRSAFRHRRASRSHLPTSPTTYPATVRQRKALRFSALRGRPTVNAI